MGYDIHVYTEFCIEYKDGRAKWFNWDDWRPNRFHGEHEGEPEWDCKNYYRERNYYLFALLANVRNGYGSEILPIAEPKGWPSDVADLTLAESENYGPDGHSHSYFTLHELFEALVHHPMDNASRQALYHGIMEPLVVRYRKEQYRDYEPFPNARGGVDTGLARIRILFFFDN